MSRQLTERDLDDALEEGEDSLSWAVTMSDLMMLLLTFFVMLFSATDMQDEDYFGMMRRIGDAMGGESLVERKADPQVEMSEAIEDYLKNNNLVHTVHMTTDARGIVLAAEGDMFFPSGTADLKPDVKRLLTKMGTLIASTNYKVLVEGHTDDTPIATARFPSNWDLSTARASSVVRFYIEEMKMEPRRFTAAGYAQYKPRYALIPENRAKNRRVEIVILREEL